MAQLVRAPPCHGGGRGFEPHPGRLQFTSADAGVAELADAQDLKSCGTYTPVPVRFRSAALVKNGRNVEFTAFLLFFCFKMFEHL